jgi:hypothetical protein
LFEADYPGEADTPLVGADCEPVATVRRAFADDVCLEGSGATLDGTGINLEGECDCGHLCPSENTKVCFFTFDLKTAAWGIGSQHQALEPLRSVAMNVEALRGKSVYLAPFDGFAVPAERGVGGFVHDGCFRVDDESYSFGEEGLDIFLGPAALLDAFERVHESTVPLEAQAGGARCAYLEE